MRMRNTHGSSFDFYITLYYSLDFSLFFFLLLSGISVVSVGSETTQGSVDKKMLINHK